MILEFDKKRDHVHVSAKTVFVICNKTITKEEFLAHKKISSDKTISEIDKEIYDTISEIQKLEEMLGQYEVQKFLKSNPKINIVENHKAPFL